MREEMDKPVNTRKAVEPKVQEWQSFIDHIDRPVDGNPEHNIRRYIPNKDNSYKFLLYQALRQKGKQGGNKRKRLAEGEGGGGGFDPLEYNRVMSEYLDENSESLLKNPLNPIGWKAFDHYKMALQQLHGFYIQQRHCEESLFELAVWGRDHKTLSNIVKNRRREIATAEFQEKMGTDATPYTQLDLIPRIEESLWNMGRRIARAQLAALRNRHAFLMTAAGVLRFESLATRNLSELFSFTWKGSRDVHDLLITMFQLPEGKFSLSLSFLFCRTSDLLSVFSIVIPSTQVRLIRVCIYLVVP
jgi:hypothetical protein